MKINNLEVTLYNTGYRVVLIAWTPSKAQFTPALIQGEGHHRSLLRAFWLAYQDWRKERAELEALA